MSHHVTTLHPTLFDTWAPLPGGGLIRSAGEEDLNDILRVLRRATPHMPSQPPEVGDVLARVDEFLIASDVHGETVGCVALRSTTDEIAELASLAVLPGDCTRHVGPALVRQCLTLAAARGYTRAWLATRRPACFLRIGFSRRSFFALPLSVQWRQGVDLLRRPPGCWHRAFDRGVVFLEREVSGRYGLVRDRGGASTAQAGGF